MNWVYTTGTEKPRQAFIAEQTLPGIVGIAACLEVEQSSVVLTIFTAEVEVRLTEKMSTELHRATKKNPPRTLKYELIYVRHLLPAPVTGYVNVALRRGRTSMMQAKERTAIIPGQRVAYSRDCVQIWMGECTSQVKYVVADHSAGLAQLVCSSSVVFQPQWGSLSSSNRDIPPRKQPVLEDTCPLGSSPPSSESPSILCE